VRSLRGRLTLLLTLGIGLVLVAGGLVMERLGSHWLWRSLEHDLVYEARALAELTEQEGDRVLFEFAEGLAPEVRTYLAPEMFELVGADGGTIERSPRLVSADLHLPRFAERADAPRVRHLTLADGAEGLMVQLDFLPRVESSGVGGIWPEAIPLSLLVARSAEAVERGIRLLRLALAGGILGILLVSALIIQGSLRAGLRPVRRIQRQVEGLRAARLDARISVPEAPSELASVVTQLNGLLGRLEASFDRERRLSSDIAHELRTPIAELRTLAEVGLRRREAVDGERALRDVLDIALQMERIVHHLLELARSESGQESLALSDLLVEAALARAWAESERRSRERGLDLVLRVPSELAVHADPDKLHLVLGNLVSNAVEHAPAGTTIRLLARCVEPTAGGGRDGRVEIAIVNRAPSLRTEDLKPMFERFWREDVARTGGSHAGLGLALVATVAKQLGIGVEATLEPGGHLRVSLLLPPGRAPLSER
jgi:signal transduction histidine kinase